MQIAIKAGESPNAEDVLNALANTVFHEDGTAWQATPQQFGRLVEIFGEGPGRPYVIFNEGR